MILHWPACIHDETHQKKLLTWDHTLLVSELFILHQLVQAGIRRMKDKREVEHIRPIGR